MNILYIGSKDRHSYSYYQYSILKKNYKKVKLIEIKNLSLILKFINLIHWKINIQFFDFIIFLILKKKINRKFDLIYVHNESLMGRLTINLLKKKSKKIFFFCADNPFVKRDKSRWRLIVNNLKVFDLVIFIQKNRLKHCARFGIKNKIWIAPTFKINEHYNNLNKKDVPKNDIILIATYFPERGELATLLFRNKFKVKIYGDHWNKYKEYHKFKNNIKPKISSDKLYVDLIKNSKVSICLPSVENDDDITNRSLEIPYIGALLLAKETNTHKIFFKNNLNAVFFKNFGDCISKLRGILKNENLRFKIALKGHDHIKKISKKISFERNIKKIFKLYL